MRLFLLIKKFAEMQKMEEKRIMKRVFYVMLAAIMLITNLPTSIMGANKDDEILSNYNIIYYEDMSSMKSRSSDSTIIVLNEDQLISLREKVEDLFSSADMIYVVTDKDSNYIQELCDMPALMKYEEASESKFATAITQDENGYYVYCDVSAIYETDGQSTRALDSSFALSETQKVNDGLVAVLRNSEELSNSGSKSARLQSAGFDAYGKDSAVVYKSSGERMGTMWYTMYTYKIVKSGDIRIFDVIAVATFAPESGYYCKKMSVYLGTSQESHEVLEAANIVSNGSSKVHSLSLSAGKTGVSGSGSTSWSYTVDAQTVTKSFDMTTNDRTWIFKPKNPGSGDAWIEEPGVRMCATQEKIFTTIKLSCPYIGIFGIELYQNTLAKTWYTYYY